MIMIYGSYNISLTKTLSNQNDFNYYLHNTVILCNIYELLIYFLHLFWTKFNLNLSFNCLTIFAIKNIDINKL